jgi:DNA-binding GntR family transcriptional regulator
MNRIESPLGISRRYLHDEVAERLRELIRDGELEPRARVNELELAERFGISRTPLREAIKILATEGLLELLPNRGARVASISEGEVNDTIEVVASIEAKHAAMLEAWRRQDNPAYFTLNREIHETIMRASGNPILQGIYATLSGRIQRARYAAHKTPEQWTKAVDEHEEILRLLKARDGERLARVLREHIRGKKPLILATYG